MAKTGWTPYPYTPSLAAAVVAFILFVVATVVITGQFFAALYSKKASRKSIRLVLTITPFIIGGLAEVVGYLGRIIYLGDLQVLPPYVMQSVLLWIAPALFAGTLYMTFEGVIMRTGCTDHLIIPIKWLTKLFVSGHLLSLFMQCSGGGLIVASKSKVGATLTIIGLFVHIAFFGFFIIVMAIFQNRVSRKPSCLSLAFRYEPSTLRNWQMILRTTFACSALVFVPSVVRAIDNLQGFEGYIFSHEPFLYTLDALPMLLNMVILSVQNLSLYYVAIYLSNDDIFSDKEIFSSNYQVRQNDI